MTDSACPDRETLRSLLSVRLSSEESERVAAHVETCADCQELIETLSAESELAVEHPAPPPAALAVKNKLRVDSTFIQSAVEEGDSLVIRELVEKLLKIPDETHDEFDNSPGASTAIQGRYRPGDRFDRFELVQCIGTGGFGNVWKARDPELDRMVAIKLQHSAGHDHGAINFIHEARAASRLSHPGVVRVYEVGERDGAVYIVSELVEGQSLQSFLRDGRLDYRQSAELVMNIARGVAAAHDLGIVHRDLKPANVMITTDGRPMILDFGLARRSTEQTISVPGMMLGTPAYMSPEQAKLEPHLAGRPADVYSVGVILFEMLTGERPFRGDPRVLLEKIVNDPPPEARTLAHRLPLDLNTVCQKCLEKEPPRRYATAGELADDLQRFISKEPILARPIGLPGRLWRWCLRQPKLAASIATLAVVIVAAVSGVTAAWLSERSARAISDTRLGTANDAVLDLTSVGFELRDMPGGVQSSQQLLTRVIQLSERIAATQDADDPEQQIRVARLLLNLSEIHRQLSDFGQAQSAADRSVDCLTPLLAESRLGSEAMVELAAAKSLEALIMADQKDHTAAIRMYDQTFEVLARLKNTTDLTHERKLDVEATAQFGKAMSLFAVGRFDDSETMLLSAAALWKNLADQKPGEGAIRYSIREATTHRVLSRLCVQAGRLDDANDYVTECLSAISLYRQQTPNSAELTEHFASALLDRATVERAEGKVADELATMTRCVAEFQSVPGLSGNPQTLLKLALAQISEAQLLHRSARLNDALAAADSVDSVVSALQTFAPESLDHQLAFAQMADIYAVILTDLGELEEALDWGGGANGIFEALVSNSPDEPLNRELLAINASHTGRLLASLGDQPGATSMFDRAEALLQDLSSSSGHRSHYYSSLVAAVLENRAWMETEAGQFDAAGKSFSDAITRRQDVLKAAPELHDNTRRLLTLLTLCPVHSLRNSNAATTSLADDYRDVERGQETALLLSALAWFRAGRLVDCRRVLEKQDAAPEQMPGPNDFVRVLLQAAATDAATQSNVRATFELASKWLEAEAPRDRWFSILAAEAEQAVLSLPDVPKDSKDQTQGTFTP